LKDLRRSKIAELFIGVMIFAAITASLFPILWSVIGSFKSPMDIISIKPKFVFRPTLENFVDIFSSNRPLLRYLYNSVIISVTSTVLAVFFASLAGYSLARIRPRGYNFISLSMVATRVLPPVVIIVPIFLFYSNTGLLDTQIGLILPYLALNIPLATWMMRSFFIDLPEELEEAASIDGCGRLATFFIIILPLTAPGIAATSLFCFILAWNDLVLALPLTSSNAAPLPVVASMARAEEGLQWGRIGAIICIMVVPVFVFTLAVMKFMIAGLAMGSVKE
jgi:ABC-type sugar transport system, permease component